jgi:hypothetical protein
MADGKKSFVLYCDQIHAFETLSDEEAGRLIKHIFKYVNDQNPEPPDRITEISFTLIKQQLKRDLKDWEQSVTKRSDAGALGNLKRWHSDIHERVIKGELTIEQGVELSKSRKVSHSEQVQSVIIPTVARVAVNVNDNVNVNVIKRQEPIIKMTGQDFIDFKERMKADALFVESLVMNKIKKNDLDRWINSYHIHITGEDKLDKNYSEYKRHFKNWLNKQDTSVVPVLLNGSVNGKTTPNYIKAESEIDWDKYKK